jgi:exodeoxyribonuclease X
MKGYPDLFSADEGQKLSPAIRVLYLDTETTGADPSTADLCEVGAVLTGYAGLQAGGSQVQEFSSLVRPTDLIPPEASAVHHITNSMVSGAPAAKQLEAALKPLVDAADVICAHNSPFDIPILKRTMPRSFGHLKDARVLDSLRLARHAWPDLPSHALQALRYRFGLGDDIGGDAHRALFDAHLVRELVEFVVASKAVECATWEELLEYARSPLDVTTFTFGKYRGSLVEDIVAQDADYVRWLLQQKWVPADYPDLFHTILRKLGSQDQER